MLLTRQTSDVLANIYSYVGGPLLLMELAFLLRGVGAQVVWITNQKSAEMNEVTYSLEHKMLDRGLQVKFCYMTIICLFYSMVIFIHQHIFDAFVILSHVFS